MPVSSLMWIFKASVRVLLPRRLWASTAAESSRALSRETTAQVMSRAIISPTFSGMMWPRIRISGFLPLRVSISLSSTASSSEDTAKKSHPASPRAPATVWMPWPYPSALTTQTIRGLFCPGRQFSPTSRSMEA